MKRLTSLFMALCLVLGSAVSAGAFEVQVSGSMEFAFGYHNNIFVDEEADDGAAERTYAAQRIRLLIELIASENLRGVFQFTVGDFAEWGAAGQAQMYSGTNDDNSGPPFQVRQAYIDWQVPDTALRVKMGFQQLTLPYANFGNPIFDTSVAAVVTNASLTDNASLTAFWARPFQTNALGTGDAAHNNLTDMFGLVFDYSGEIFSVSPWALYAKLGNNSGWYESNINFTGMADPVDPLLDPTYGPSVNENSDLFAFGLALTHTPTDALTIKFDGMYGQISDDGDRDYKAGGYWLALGVDYELDWGTPGIFAWYASGDDADDLADNETGRLPGIGLDGSVWASSFGFYGSQSIGYDGALNPTGAGTWGVGLQIADMSFVEDLSHTARILYWQGTNDDEIGKATYAGPEPLSLYGMREVLYLTTEDSVIEVNFNTNYQIYENLTAALELGYMYLNADSDLNKNREESAYSAMMLFIYAF
ncbi:MAG: outer membrane homotrimeric porin [Deltaproteobacteria bacterium]|nr:outer membrane homotrimeric porin [Deltaproteobacteria bacterium]